MLESTQSHFRESLKTLLQLRLHNAGIKGLKIEVMHGEGDLSVRIIGDAVSVNHAQKVLRNYGQLIDYQILN